MDLVIKELAKLCLDSGYSDEKKLGQILENKPKRNEQSVDVSSLLKDKRDSLCQAVCGVASDLVWLPFPHPHQSFTLWDVQQSTNLEETGLAQVSLLYVAQGVTIPQHGEESDVYLRVLSGKSSKIGTIQETLELAEDGYSKTFMPGEPKIIEAGPEQPLLLLMVKTGVLNGSFWYSNVTTTQYDNVYKCPNAREFYDACAEEYESLVRSWGYCLPEVTVRSILPYLSGEEEIRREQSVLDLGCGDGLVGLALQKAGFRNVRGFDLSQKMVEKAKLRGCYREVKQTNLMEGLPIEKSSVDVIFCVGVTTYLGPEVVKDWIHVSKPGAFICFTLKSGIEDKWMPDLNKMVQDGQLGEVWLSQDLPYLPSLSTEAEAAVKTLVRIFVYKKKN